MKRRLPRKIRPTVTELFSYEIATDLGLPVSQLPMAEEDPVLGKPAGNDSGTDAAPSGGNGAAQTEETNTRESV